MNSATPSTQWTDTQLPSESGADAKGGGKGLLYGVEQAHTISTRQDQMVFTKTADNSNCMKSDNPHSGYWQTEVARTLDCTAPSMHKNQGGEAVVCIAGQHPHAEITHGISPTIPAASGIGGGYTPCVVSYDMTHACDVIRQNEGAVQTLQHRMGTGGNQIPLVQEITPSCFGQSSFGSYSDDVATLKASGGDLGGAARISLCRKPHSGHAQRSEQPNGDGKPTGD